MSLNLQTLGIDRLGLDDRIALVTAIWDSIAAEPHSPLLSEAQQAELNRRLAEHASRSDDVIPWERVKGDALARFKQ
ncbi:MAG TPA: addiction module protein [Pirellulales bacterium]